MKLEIVGKDKKEETVKLYLVYWGENVHLKINGVNVLHITPNKRIVRNLLTGEGYDKLTIFGFHCEAGYIDIN